MVDNSFCGVPYPINFFTGMAESTVAAVQAALNRKQVELYEAQVLVPQPDHFHPDPGLIPALELL